MTASTDTSATRRRIEGAREQEILTTTRSVLADVGYDRLTLDAVAMAAKASKATLYRRWNGKLQLVIDALFAEKVPLTVVDTGSLREDLLETHCGLGGMTDEHALATFTSVLTAIARDPEFAQAYRTQVLGPKVMATRAIFERARQRGEVAEHADLDVLAPALAGVMMHRFFALGEVPARAGMARVIDHIIIPAATHAGPAR